jgi:hypothetical protein
MLLSVGGRGQDASWVRPLDGVSYRFLPIGPVTPTESGHQSNARMLELVILAESDDCPDTSLRGADGHFHTGDLFQEPRPGHYVFRGRNDDWIKSENSLRCDTKYVFTIRHATEPNLMPSQLTGLSKTMSEPCAVASFQNV